MRRARRTFSSALRRAITIPTIVFAVVSSYVVCTELLSGAALQRWRGGGDEVPTLAEASNTPTWRAGYDERFPGCVPAADWPRDRLPVAVVVVRRSGEAVRMSFQDAHARSGNHNRADDVWVVGGCR